MEKDVKMMNNENRYKMLDFDEIFDVGLSTSVSETCPKQKKKVKK